MNVLLKEPAGESAEKRLAFQKSYSVEHGESWRRKSLIEDARFDTASNAEYVKCPDDSISESSSSGNDVRERTQSGRESISEEDEGADEEAVKGDEKSIVNVTRPHPTDILKVVNVIVSLKEGLSCLPRILKCFENFEVTIDHVESRVPQSASIEVEVLFQCKTKRHRVMPLVNGLKQSRAVADVKVTIEEGQDETIWFPTHISQLDCCQHLLTKFEPELDFDHPGFTDPEYRKRRQYLANLAFNYKTGDPIPHVEYTEAEINTWATVYRTVKKLFKTHTCREYITMFEQLERDGVYREDAIPQLEELSNIMKRLSGFALRPVAGLLTARDFLASLAFRVFQCTQYVRHPTKPHYSPEPDCVHDILGHVPMLCNPTFAQFSQELGLATLGASDEDIEKFSTLYWFTVEFGLLRQDGEVRAYGAGTMSSFGELQHALSDTPEKRPFDAAKAAVQDYRDEDYQPIYFIVESFDDMKEKMRAYAATIKRPYELRYNPYNQSVTILDQKNVIEDTIADLKREISFVERALARVTSIDVK